MKSTAQTAHVPSPSPVNVVCSPTFSLLNGAVLEKDPPAVCVIIILAIPVPSTSSVPSAITSASFEAPPLGISVPVIFLRKRIEGLMESRWMKWICAALLCGLPAALSAQSTEEDDDLIEVTIGTVTKTMMREEFLRSGLVPLQPKTTADLELDRLIKSGELAKLPRPYPTGAVSLESRQTFDWPGGVHYSREELKARLDQAVQDLSQDNSDKRAMAAGFIKGVWRYAKVRYEPSIAPLKVVLSDPNTSTRREAAEALAYLGETESARATLEEQCEYKFLAEMNGKKFLSTIKKRRAFPFTCRIQAIAYLESLADSAEAKRLLVRLAREGWASDSRSDESGYKGREYVHALGRLGNAEARGLLERIRREDPNEDVREEAAEELKKTSASRRPG